MNTKGYIFQNYFDVICYMMISVIYPVLTVSGRSSQSGEEVSGLNMLITGLLFSATFFYDYYQKYRDCNEQTVAVVNILFIGRFVFCVLTLLSFLMIIMKGIEFITGIDNLIKYFFYILPFTALYPLLVAIFELIKRLLAERKRKISKVTV